MATVHVALSRVTPNSRAQTGSTMPVSDSVEIAADTMTPAGTSAQSSVVADSANTGLVWTVVATGGSAWVAFGPDPIAGADVGWLLLDGGTLDKAVSGPSEKCAVKAFA